MIFDQILITLLIILFFFDKQLKSRKLLLRFIMELRFIKNTKIFILCYFLIFFLINLIFISIKLKILLIIYFYYLYYIYKFLFYIIHIVLKNFTIKYNFIYSVILSLILIKFNLIFLILTFIFILDFIVCINNSNDEYDLAFIGFTEEFFEIILTEKGLLKIVSYFELLIYNNTYFYDELKDNFYYRNDIDFFYKDYNDNYK